MVSLRPRKPKKEEKVAAAASTRKKVVKARKPEPAPAAKKAANPQRDDKPAEKKSKNNASLDVLKEFLKSTVVAEHPTKHADITILHDLIRKKAPDLGPELQGKATLAYGGFDYQTKSKCTGRWSRISIMVNKTGLSLMVSGEKDGKYLLETYPKKHFGKASIGKSCIRFQKLTDLTLEHVEDLIVEAARANISSIAV